MRFTRLHNKPAACKAGAALPLLSEISCPACLSRVVRLYCMFMSPTAPNCRRVVLIGIVALVVLGFVHTSVLIVDGDTRWSSWLTPLGFWIVAFLAYKFELDEHDDAT